MATTVTETDAKVQNGGKRRTTRTIRVGLVRGRESFIRHFDRLHVADMAPPCQFWWGDSWVALDRMRLPCAVADAIPVGYLTPSVLDHPRKFDAFVCQAVLYGLLK